MDINGNLQKMVKKMDNICLVLLEKVCEAIYFSLFLIYGKNLKEKRLLFIAIMIFEYLALKYFIKFNVLFQLSYTFMTYLTLKVLYKEKAQITDIFLFALASLFLILISIISYTIIYFTIRKYIVALILNRILIFGLIFIIKKDINAIYQKFYKLWNRHNKPNRVKSLTLRNISVIIFNLMFCIINICMAFSYILNS